MRLTPEQIAFIKSAATDLAGPEACVRLFGSRLDDNARGGDVDLLLEVPNPVEHPALLAARLAARVSRGMGGRKVDVLLSAPNLQPQPIHKMARREGRLL
jgi:hypothetical protein